MGAVDTTYTFTATDTITSSKMNNIIDQTTMTADAIIGTTLEVASGKLKIRGSGITSNEIGANQVITTAIANGSVTPAKLSTGGPTWVGQGFNISQVSIELGSGITTNSGCFIDFHSVHPLTDFECRLIRDQGPNGWFAIQNNGAGAISLQSAAGVAFGTAIMPNPIGTAPIYGCRAWVNFDASRDSSGAINTSNTNRLIRASGNVTSVLKTATGKFTVTFTTAMSDTNYAVTCTSGTSPGSPRFAAADRSTATTTTVKIETDDASGSAANFNENNVMVIR